MPSPISAIFIPSARFRPFWIEGVGKKKRVALVEKFGSIDKIMHASIGELMQVDGVGENLAKQIKKFFEDKI